MGYALAVGSYELSLSGVVRALLGQADGPMETVIWNIRFPRIVAAILSGWGLGLAGIAFQSLLKNPLASPSTLGISQGAAFGAGGMQAGSLRAQGASPLNIYSLYAVTLFAFGGALAATLVILAGENLTDKNYEYLPGYPAPGITILGGVNLSF
jgi:iron complex transport system permease protein